MDVKSGTLLAQLTDRGVLWSVCAGGEVPLLTTSLGVRVYAEAPLPATAGADLFGWSPKLFFKKPEESNAANNSTYVPFAHSGAIT